MLGLERNVDARPPDDAPDAAVDGQVCLEDNFKAGALDTVRWDQKPPENGTITTPQMLVFRFNMGAPTDSTGFVRTKSTFDLRENEIEALLATAPPPNTETRLAVMQSSTPLYELRITAAPHRLRLFDHGNQVHDVPLEGNFLRMRFRGDELIVGSGASAGSYSAHTTDTTDAPNGVTVQISAVATLMAAVPIDVAWDHIVVKCR